MSSRFIRGSLVLAVASLAAFAAHAQGPSPESIKIAEQLRDTASNAHPLAFSLVEELTTQIGARPAGSPGMTRAKDWAVAKFRALKFDDVRVEEYDVPAWTRGVETAEVTAPYPQALHITALGGSIATAKGGLEAPIALFDSYDAFLASAPGAVKGKIAVITERTVSLPGTSTYMVTRLMRSGGPSEAAKRGAVGLLIRSLGTEKDRFAHTGGMRYADGVAKIPAAALSNPDADQLERMVKMGATPRVKMVLTSQGGGTAKAWNIVGEVKGASKPEDVVLLGAHIDSWDLGTGAIDDGAGVAIVMAATKLIADAPTRPARTIRVVLFGAEEIGIAGGAYLDANKPQLERIVIASESDLGSDAVYRVGFPAKFDDATAKAIIKTLKPLNVVAMPGPATDGGADIDPMARAGVPIFQLVQDPTRYFDYHHTANDTLDKIERKPFDQNVAAWVATAYLLADTPADYKCWWGGKTGC